MAPFERGEPDMTPTLIPDTGAVMTSADRCRARAATRVTLASGYDLLCCSHHSRRDDEACRVWPALSESQMGVLLGGAQR